MSHASAASDPTEDCMLAGWVYIDCNNDGQLAFADDPRPEWIISGVEVSLFEVTTFGESLVATTETNSEGRYVFAGLAPGTYSLYQTQPEGYVDGLDTLGMIIGAAGPLTIPDVSPGWLAEDAFEQIVLPANTRGDYYNFGERGLMPGYVSKRYLLGTAPPMATATEIPEPGTAVLLVTAIGYMLVGRRRKLNR